MSYGSTESKELLAAIEAHFRELIAIFEEAGLNSADPASAAATTSAGQAAERGLQLVRQLAASTNAPQAGSVED